MPLKSVSKSDKKIVMMRMCHEDDEVIIYIRLHCTNNTVLLHTLMNIGNYSLPKVYIFWLIKNIIMIMIQKHHSSTVYLVFMHERNT